MATTEENRNFSDAVLGSWPLDAAVDWIASNLDPDDVFDEKDLSAWAEAAGFVEAE